MNQTNARRGVLVIQPLPGIGDMVWHLPHLRAIARHEPEGRVSVLTKPRSLSDQLLASLPEVAEVLWVQRKPGRHDGLRGFFRLVSELRHQRYRKVWILHDSSRYLVAAWLAGIPRRAGIAGGWQRMLLTDLPAAPVPSTLHTVERADCLLCGLAVDPDRPVPLITPQAAGGAAIRARFAAFPRPWFVLGIGSSEAYKQWGASNFSALANSLLQRYGGSCFLLGGISEQVMADGYQSRTWPPRQPGITHPDSPSGGRRPAGRNATLSRQRYRHAQSERGLRDTQYRLVRSSDLGLGGEQFSPNSSDISRSWTFKQWSRANSAIRGSSGGQSFGTIRWV